MRKIMKDGVVYVWVKSMGFMKGHQDEYFDGRYGSYGERSESNRHIWDVNEGGEYLYKAVIDDFGNLEQINRATCIRGY